MELTKERVFIYSSEITPEKLAEMGAYASTDELYRIDVLAYIYELAQNRLGSSHFVMVQDSYMELYVKRNFQAANEVNLDEWPYNCIDWERAAWNRERISHMVPVQYDGAIYYLTK